MPTITLTPTSAPVSGGETTAHVIRMTAKDAHERCLDYWGGQTGGLPSRDAKRAINDALRQLAPASRWTHQWTYGRINLHAAYATGTIAYDHTGGAYENMVTLTDGTWPAWARLCRIRIAGLTYPVLRRISSSIIVLDDEENPGADVDAETEYSLNQDAYEMPLDFITGAKPTQENCWGGMTWVSPEEWASHLRYHADTTGQPIWFTFTGQRGRLLMQIAPPADSAQTIDFVYQRKPRPIQIWDYSEGRVSVNIATYPRLVTVAGGGVFNSSMVGSVIRLSSDTQVPTSYEGDRPAAAERTILVYVDSSTVEVDEDFTQSFSSVGYRISDPIDLEDMTYNAFWRCVERQGAIVRILKNAAQADSIYFQELRLAKEADVRMLSERSAGRSLPYRQRLADMPRGEDVS